MNGGQLVVKTLEARGFTHIFGVPGAKINAVFDALVDSTIEAVLCRHEQNETSGFASGFAPVRPPQSARYGSARGPISSL